MNKCLILIFCFVFLYFGLYAQDPTLSIIAKVEKEKVILRWMPQDFDTWQKGNQFGYQLKRQTVRRNNEIISEAPILLTQKPLLPLKMDYWSQLSKKNKFASVAAKFLTEPAPEDQESKDLSLAIAMLMSNTSGAISGGMALLWEDKTSKPNEQYNYILTIFGQDISANCLVNMTDITKLTPPSNLYGEFQDSTVFIRWQVADSVLHSAFIVERSDDGGLSFQSIQDEPILALAEPDSLGRFLGAKSQRLPRFYQDYYYRVKAFTPFGILSESSNVVKVHGYRTRLPLPKVSHKIPPHKGVLLSWIFPDSLNNDIRGFDILRAEKLGEKYEKLNPKRLSRQTRMFVDSLPLSEGYYQVAVINWAYKSLPSYPEFVQLEDSIPPIKPLWKSYKVDDKGIVSLRWKANHEKDFLGYSIFRGDNPKREFSLITGSIIADSVYRDTVSLNLLNKKIYYSIVAYDKRLNSSIHADTVIIKRPDIIPPASPNFTDFVLSDSTILVSWVNSPSEDLDTTFLYRSIKADSSHSRQLLYSFAVKDSTNTFTDTTALEKILYQYQLVAKDDAALLSKPALIELELLFTGVRRSINPINFELLEDTHTLFLEWNPPEEAVKKYILYRKKGNNEKMALYKIFEGKNGSFKESDIETNLQYSYRISAVFADDSESKVSNVFDAPVLKK
jgi:fibronectin type 3 domain-containing protein